MLFSQLPVRAGQSVMLAWNPSSATNVAGYNIYYGTASHNYTNVVPVGNTTNATISGLVAGTTYYFAATTFDSVGDESAFSNEASYAVPLITPTITTLPAASPISYGQTLASSSLSGGAASTGGSFAFTTPGLAPGAGTATASVTFTPADTNDYTVTTATVTVTVNQTLATLTSAASSGGQFSFTVSGLAGATYVVQASTDLIDWDSVQTNTAPFVFTDPAAGSFSQRFYRTYYLSP